MAPWYSMARMNHGSLNHSPTEGHWVVSGFWLQNKAATCICIQVPPSVLLFLSSIAALVRYNSHTVQSNCLECVIQWFLVYSQSCESSPRLQKIFISLERKPKPFSDRLPNPVPKPQVTINPLPFSLYSSILGIWYK